MSGNNQITWTTERIRLGDLIEWEHNPVQLSKHDFEQIRISLDKFGLVLPLVANRPKTKRSIKRRLIDGHQRKTIMVYAEMADLNTEFDVRVPSRKLTDRECDELSIRLRKNTGDFDFDILANVFQVDDLLDWGFENRELDLDLWGIDEPEDDLGAQIDRAEELRELWGVETGQLWRLGEHRLICGDCTDAAIVENGEPYNMILTDPPYGVEYSGQKPTMYYGKDTKGKAREEIINDDIHPGDVISKMLDLSHAPILFVWRAPQMQSIIKSVIEAKAFDIFTLIVWNKNHANFGAMGARYKPKFEMATVAVRDKIPWFEPDNEVTVWDIDRASVNEFHPTQKPIELFERAIRNHTDKEQIIYDPFLGSGTTLIASERLGRKCRAVEISPAYVAVALQRWADLTGGEPELIDNE